MLIDDTINKGCFMRVIYAVKLVDVKLGDFNQTI